MLDSTQAIIDNPPLPRTRALRAEFAIHRDFDSVEEEWRRFEAVADCTVFQSFDWLSCWYRHIGRPSGVRPVIVVGRREGDTQLILPLAIVPGMVRRLTFLGSELCDYNAPLIAPDYAQRVSPIEFLRVWQNILGLLHGRFDLVELTKMPETVGAQRNPLLALDVGLNPSGAHATQLPANWDEFYQAKRSSGTRRRDRTKRKRLGEFGEVHFVTPRDTGEIARTLDTLMAQKAKSFARMGVGNIFERPGCREFFIDIATNACTRSLTHVSRLDVGEIAAAINLGLTFRGSYYHVLASYDDGDLSRFGPGAAHLRDLLAYAIEIGCTRFDFTIGDERYKREWSDCAIDLYDHVACASARGWPLATFALVRRRLVRLIKQNPLLWSAFSRMRSTFGMARAKDDLPAERKSPPIAPE